LLVEQLTTTCEHCGTLLHGEVRLRPDGRKYEWWNLGEGSQSERPSQCSRCEAELQETQDGKLMLVDDPDRFL
jgi:hypothetical protein